MIRRLTIAIVLLACIVLELQVEIDVLKADFISKQKRPFVPPRAGGVKHASLGYHMLVADAYWLQAVQCASDAGEDFYEPENLYLLTNFITELDPRFAHAYHLTGINLMITDGDFSQIAAILEKGKRHRPDYWKIFFDLGFFYYFYLYDAEKAGENMEQAYKLTGHAPYALLASRIRSEAGGPELGIKFLMEMIKQTEDEKAKERFEKRIEQLKTTILERDLSAAVELYYRYKKEYPSRIEDLVRAGIIERIPEHPVPGHRLIYDPEEKKIRSEPRIYSKVYDPWREKREKKESKNEEGDGG